jgi:tetratricopeptide (TPR) repeat protein
MKKCFVLMMLMVSGVFAFAGDSRYETAMKQQILAVYQSGNIESLQSAVNSLDRIASAEKDKWEPLYYIGFGYVMMANRETNGTTKDQYLDRADAAALKAIAISPNNSEIIALQGFITMIRLTVDPATRGPRMSGQAMQLFGQAIALNPDNPRALGLMAQMQAGTAKFFGASLDESCATARKALGKFVPREESTLAPTWGKEMVEEMLKTCQ